MTKASPNASANNGAAMPDPVALGQALLAVYERATPILETYFARMGEDLAKQNFDPFHIKDVYLEFLNRMAADPEKFWQMQQGFWNDWFRLWQESAMKFLGEDGKTIIQPEKGDRRFKAPEWQESALFDFIKQSYLLTCHWMDKTVRGAEGLDTDKKEKLVFYTKLFVDALSPTNFMMTNPEVLKETLKTGGENLVKGLENLVADLERGGGELKISTTDYNAFKLGENIANTPGNVIYQNDLIQLIQYEPMGDKVFKRPLLIIPPWINKYYILDLREDNSFIRWAVEQGHTVFAVSWVNPDAQLAQKRFEDYMQEGVLDALEQIRDITGEPDCNVVGYCLGGTLLAITLAWLADKKKENLIASATFLTTLLDFENSGDLKLFMDDSQLELMDQAMAEKGVLEAKNLQKTFTLLRANDLIWSFVVNNYLMGRDPFPFDLLYWNDDSTNMPAAMHSFYLRKMYRDNELTKPGGIAMLGTPIDLRKITAPAYFLSTREDHIAPWRATYAGLKLLGSKNISFTLAASGHIAGIVNAPVKNKYCYWTSPKPGAPSGEWMDAATQNEGSWWPHWQKWIATYAGEKTAARKVGKGIEPAPGSYVKKKSS
ncbi:MAG TPA: class I poly(R)-hydroxyalkanoic acid synthase [Alphaproteobacteria bacterium]|jgi:polyhydroxyalkanoate synthase subunit PhaC|nr:class I poly(R)-hydroxyalkanoic acid synthase [Alphaproteobacteria bacterium]